MQTNVSSSSFDVQDARKVRFVIGLFPWLQGLRVLSLPLLTLGWGIWLCFPVGAGRIAPQLFCVLVVSIPLTLAAHPIGKWYTQTFGVARPRRQVQRGLLAVMGIIAVAGAVGGFLLGSRTHHHPGRLDAALHITPVELLIFAAMAGIVWLKTGRILTSALLAAVSAIFFAALLLTGWSPVCAVLSALPFTSTAHCELASVLLAVGSVGVGMALLDHRLIATTLGRRTVEE